MPSPRPVTGSVRVVPGNHGVNKNVNEMFRKAFNKDADTTALRRKSGELAKTRAAQVDVGKPKAKVKINSNLGGLTGTKKIGGGGGGFFGLPKNR